MTDNLRVLIVDDDPDTHELFAMFLRRLGYQTVVADSAAAALAAAREQSFDLILSDIGMPRMNGYELAVALRKLPAYKKVPMIAVTGFSLYDDRKRSLQAGFTHHLTKPVDLPILKNLIERLNRK